MKKVAVIMGSDSDWPVVKGACAQLQELGIPFEAHILSAHRTPAAAADFARNARKNLKPRRKPGGTQLSTRTAAPMSPDARKMLVKALQAASALLHAIPGATTSAKIIATTSEHYKISQDEVRAIMKEEGIRL